MKADKNLKHIKEFLNSRKLISIATIDDNLNPWICNVYYVTDTNLNFYFMSSLKSNHSSHIKKNSKVAFTISWYNENNLGVRKAVQGVGEAEEVGFGLNLIKGLTLYSVKFNSDYKDLLNKVEKKLSTTRLYKITPKYIKYLDDEVLGNKQTVEYNL